ncbi:MAG: hypothetical protein EOO77_38920 [Oxalobacteraceae bacterium]|nr:MAG: hypothetical protein EOO77_38920 [Oxalobacteraceae bacterium]
MNSSNGAAGHFEPEVTHTFLPGCRECGGSHPLARKPQQSPDRCPDCGAPAGKIGPTIREGAVLSGYSPAALFSRATLAIGAALTNLSKRI